MEGLDASEYGLGLTKVCVGEPRKVVVPDNEIDPAMLFHAQLELGHAPPYWDADPIGSRRHLSD